MPNGNIHWSNIFGSSFKCTGNAQLNVFQYKLIHIILQTEKMAYPKNVYSDFVETLLYVFIECQIILCGRRFLFGYIIT